MDGGSSGERRLRWLAEAVVTGATGPALEGMAAFEELDEAAAALIGCGLISPGIADGIVSETVDALVVRGVEWLAPALPDLDVHSLVAASTEVDRPELRRVAVSSHVRTGGVASVELWSDRTIVRFFDPRDASDADDDGPGRWRELPAIAPGQRRLEVQWESFERTGISLEDGHDAVVVDAGGRSIDPAGYLERLSHHLGATALVERSLERVERLRRRLSVSASVLTEGPAILPSLLEAFDGEVADVVLEGGVPEEAIAVAIRSGDLSLLSIERWSDHWRLFVSEGPAGRGAFWTAVVDGATFGGVFAGTDRIDFRPALPESWTRLSLDLVDRGRCRSFAVPR